MSNKINDNTLSELDWLKVREEINKEYVTETIFDKAIRKSRENPFVPLGALATTTALTAGIVSFYKGDTKRQQFMMRARVGAQAFTIACIVIGFIMLPRTNT